MKYPYILTFMGAWNTVSALVSSGPFEDLQSRDIVLPSHAIYVRDTHDAYLARRGAGKKAQYAASPTPPRANTPPLFRTNSLPSRGSTPPPPSSESLETSPRRASTPPAPRLDSLQHSGSGIPSPGTASPRTQSPDSPRASSRTSSQASTSTPPRRIRQRPGSPDPATPEKQGIPVEIPGAPARKPLKPWEGGYPKLSP